MAGVANNEHSGTTGPQAPLSIRVNILQEGKRVLPRLDLPAGQTPDLETLKQLITRRFPGQLPGIPSESALDPNAGNWNTSVHWKFKVFLPEGLTPVHNDGEWTIALLSAGNVDWMDGDLKVLVELECP